MTGWRYLATRLHGDGTETFLSYDVPLQDPGITEDLSGPGDISGKLSPELDRLQAPDGEPLLVPWATAIYAEKDGEIRGGAIVTDLTEAGAVLTPHTVGFSGYLQGQPYTGDISRVGVDPLDMARHIWAHQQGLARGNLGLVLEGTRSPVRIGTAETDVKFTTDNGEEVGFESGPYTLAWWKDHDMGGAFDTLAAETPFEYLVVHEWDGETIRHRMRLGYPTLGARLHDLSFVVGVNILEIPPVAYSGEDYADEVLLLGAGQGRKMIRGSSTRPTTRLHRTVVVEDKSITAKAPATAAAAREVAARLGDPDISTFVVTDHPNALLGSFAPGDEILVQTRGGWGPGRELWVRILSITTHPEQGRATVTATRVEKLE